MASFSSSFLRTPLSIPKILLRRRTPSSLVQREDGVDAAGKRNSNSRELPTKTRRNPRPTRNCSARLQQLVPLAFSWLSGLLPRVPDHLTCDCNSNIPLLGPLGLDCPYGLRDVRVHPHTSVAATCLRRLPSKEPKSRDDGHPSMSPKNEQNQNRPPPYVDHRLPPASDER